MTEQTPTNEPINSQQGENQQMTAINSLVPVSGTNEHQQHIAFDRSKPLELSVANASGKVRVSGSHQDGIWLVVHRTDGKAEDPAAVIPISVSIDGNSVSIHPDWTMAGGLSALAKKIKDQLQYGLNPSDWNLDSFRIATDLNYDIRVDVPMDLVAESKVTVKTASGAITLNALSAHLSVVSASGSVSGSALSGIIATHTASGSISLEQVNGSLEVNSASGAVSVRGGEAWSSVRTVSGRIQIEDFTMKHARVASVSGAITARFVANNAQSYTFSTVSGKVTLDTTLPASVTSSLASRSASGSAQVAGDWQPTDRRRWTTGSGEPGPSFDVKTVSGSLSASARLDGGLLALKDPLPEVEASRDANGASQTPDDVTLGAEPHRHESNLDLDVNLEGITNWAKDFAKDFRKNFSSLGTPPEPLEPERPTTPTPSTPPQAPTAPVPPTEASQPWTGSNASGAGTPPPPPNAAPDTTPQEQTAPVTTSPPTEAHPEEVPVTPEPANTVEDAEAFDSVESQEAERLRVLAELERGDIDIDEALARLDPESNRG